MSKTWWKQIADRVGHKDEEGGEAEAFESPLPELKDEPMSLNTDGDQPGAFARWIQRRQLESGADQMMEAGKAMTESLEKILESSQAQNEKLERVAKHQEQSVNLLDRQGKTLEEMVTEIKQVSSSMDRLIAALEALPKSTREQGDKLSAIEEQLQSDGQTDRALLTSMDTLGRNVAALARYAETQQANREEFTQGLTQQIRPMIDLAKRQAKFNRITLVFTSIIAVALLAFLALYIKNML
jgi:chromosome segregation ATPase